MSKFLQYTVKYKSKETASVVSGCSATVEVFAGILGTSQPPAPTGIALHQNLPNPFSSATTISYEVPRAVQVRITVYDVFGREVGRPVDAVMDAGRHNALFNGVQLPDGMYVCRMEAADVVKSMRMLLLR